MISKIILLNIILLFLGGCSRKVAEIEEQSSVIALIILFTSLGYLYLLPRLKAWKVSKNVIDALIVNPAYFWVVATVAFGVFCLFLEDPISLLLSISLFVTSALILKMKLNYYNKSEEQKISDLRYVTFAIPTNIVLIFLLNNGLEKILG
jgi:steroid 5-alpha reductase family enzyme